MPYDYLPVLFQVLIAIGFAAVTLTLSVVFGRSGKTNKTKDSAYECGMLPIGEGAPRFSVKFYLVAMLFVIFDVETIFIVSWAIAFHELGWYGYIGVMVFVILLFVVLIYEWRNGALDFGPDGGKILKAYKKLRAEEKKATSVKMPAEAQKKKPESVTL